MTQMEAPNLVGSAEAATLLGIDRSTLTRWVKAQKLIPAHRGSGATGEFFFARSDIAAIASGDTLALAAPTSRTPVTPSVDSPQSTDGAFVVPESRAS